MGFAEKPSVHVRFTPEFKRNLHLLAKKYRQIRADVQPVIAQIQAGELPGDQIPGVGFTIFKVRIRNRSAAKGKQGGYRLIYWLQARDEVVLITIYSKSEQSDVTANDIRRILHEFEKSEP